MTFNLLTDDLPRSVWVAGAEYAVNADTRTILRALAFTGAGLGAEQAGFAALTMFFAETPNDVNTAAAAMIDFINRPSDEYGKRAGGKSAKRGETLYLIEYDANLIFAAFWQCYGVTDPGALHWWVFKALLNGLPDDCLFARVMGWRGEKPRDGKHNAEYNNHLRKMKDVFALPDNRTQKEREADFFALF